MPEANPAGYNEERLTTSILSICNYSLEQAIKAFTTPKGAVFDWDISDIRAEAGDSFGEVEGMALHGSGRFVVTLNDAVAKAAEGNAGDEFQGEISDIIDAAQGRANAALEDVVKECRRRLIALASRAKREGMTGREFASLMKREYEEGRLLNRGRVLLIVRSEIMAAVRQVELLIGGDGEYKFMGPKDPATCTAHCLKRIGQVKKKSEWLSINKLIFKYGLHHNCRHVLVAMKKLGGAFKRKIEKAPKAIYDNWQKFRSYVRRPVDYTWSSSMESEAYRIRQRIEEKYPSLTNEDSRPRDNLDRNHGVNRSLLIGRVDGSSWVLEGSAGQVDSVIGYTGPRYSRINSYLRYGAGDSGHGRPDMSDIRNMDSVMARSKTKEPMVLFRSVARGRMYDEIMGLQPGDAIVDKGFMSATVSEASEVNFHGKRSLLMELLVPEGTPALYAERIADVDSSELEYILDRGLPLVLRKREGRKFIFQVMGRRRK